MPSPSQTAGQTTDQTTTTGFTGGSTGSSTAAVAPNSRGDGPADTGGIAVIVVNYAAADLAIEAVQSVLDRDHGRREVELHLVDNASPGADAGEIRAAHQERGWGAKVTLWLEQENHGFGRGNNLVLRSLAAREIPPRYVMLLNPDAQLANDTLVEMADFLDATPAAGMAGAGISMPDGTPVPAAFRFPSAMGEFVAAVNFGPVARAGKRFLVPLPPDAPRGPVGWVAGAAVMARLDRLKALGFFDPAYFLYYEEMDLMLQLQRSGSEIWYLPEARVIHAEGASTGVQSTGEDARRRRPPYWYRSWRHYFSKNHGRSGALLAGAGWMAGAAINHALVALRGGRPLAPLNFFGDFWNLVYRPLLGLPERSPAPQVRQGESAGT